MLVNFKILFAILVLCMSSVFLSCEDADDLSNNPVVDKKFEKEQLENANKFMIAQEKEAIDGFIERNGIEMAETGTGLRYHIVKQGDTAPIKTGDIVVMEYEMRFLTGEMIYCSEQNGPKAFRVGRGGVESGLEEAVLHLHRGDEAEIIIPSHLAYGLVGDGDKIPPRAALFYKVKIIDNQSNK